MQIGLEKDAKKKGVIVVRLEHEAERRRARNLHLGRCGRRAETKAEASLERMKMVMSKRNEWKEV